MVECIYSSSGSYGPTSRFIFYILVVISISWRRVGWAARVSLGTVMVYSSTTAIHAIVSASIRTRLLLAADPEAANYEVVRVQGTSVSGNRLSDDEMRAMGDDSLWMPVVPMAWDVDPGPVLTVVGVAFLVLLPMQIWSRTLRASTSNVKLIVLLWGLLLFAGSICALVAEAYIQFWAFPQLRFCPPGFNDSLPLTNDGGQTVGGTWDGLDPYHWNRTVQARFVDGTDTDPLGNICIYPCFDTAWPLREATEIQVFAGDFGLSSEGDPFYAGLVAIFFLFGATSLANLSIAVVMSEPGRRALAAAGLGFLSEMVDHGDGEEPGRARFPWHKTVIMCRRISQRLTVKRPGPGVLERGLVFAVQSYFVGVFVYAWLCSLPVCLYFLGFMEHMIWTSEPPGESFRHVGQWGTMVGVLLTLSAADVECCSVSEPQTDPNTVDSHHLKSRYFNISARPIHISDASFSLSES